MRPYDHKKIEKKWQRYWEKKKLFAASNTSKKPKFYGLIEFPYPSAEGLHVGHIRSNTAMDIIARKRRAEGYEVLYPIGWDAFGLPTENYAIKTGIHPAIVTKKNTGIFRRQLKALGFSFDWSREINTTDPNYYKWTQWIFLQFFKKGLAYKKKMAINWCPKDKIGLANEEVVDGKCERCGTAVEKREKEQWMLAITKYADRLDRDLDALDFWGKIKIQQKNWIGKSEGMIFRAPVKDTNLHIETFSAHFEAFCADTFVVIAPDHPFLAQLVETVQNKQEVLRFAQYLLNKRLQRGNEEEKESEGIFTGRYIVDPVGNGDLPIWVASYALADYGTGIVKCSVHDERDFKFAKKYHIKLKPVLFPADYETAEKVKNLEACFSDMGAGILKEPKEFDGKVAMQERSNIIKYLEEHGLAKAVVTYKLRDWVFSRQRYWGEPIPLVNCQKCGWVPVPEKDLPVKLPKVKNYKPTDTGESPLSAISKWVNVKCPKCEGRAKRETDTMPNWAGSSWYYLRYTDPKNKKEFAGRKALDYWTPVDWYNGGMEHTTLHLLYSRFWHKFLFDLGLVPTSEPYAKRTSHGLILAPGGAKMSKSKGNVINPDDTVRQFGADTLRLYEMFMGPFDQHIVWSTESIIGPRRFLEKVWKIGDKVKNQKSKFNSESQNSKFEILFNQTIKKVGNDIEQMRFNTAVSAMMILANDFEKSAEISRNQYEIFLQLLAPFAPHISEELWSKLGHKTSVHLEPWPVYDQSLSETGAKILVVQINGKTRASMNLENEWPEEAVAKKAEALPAIQKWLQGKQVKKTVYVKGRLINFVL